MTTTADQPPAAPQQVHGRVLVRGILAVLVLAVLSGRQAAANTLILEGNDGRVLFGDAGTDPAVERAPNMDASGADQLVVRGEGGLRVDGPLSASLLDLNSTGGVLTANEITVNTLIVNGAAPASQANGCKLDSVSPRIALTYAAGGSISSSRSAPTVDITGTYEWFDRWTVIESRSYDPDGVFSVKSTTTALTGRVQQVTVHRNGTYQLALENWIRAGTDNRYAEVRTAVDGAQVVEAGRSHCMLLASRDDGDRVCSVYFPAGTVLGIYVEPAGAGTGAIFTGLGIAHPSWSVTLLQEQ